MAQKLIIGCAKEIKLGENRVGLTPDTVRKLTAQGSKVLIGEAAGEGSGFSNQDYINAGAEIIENKKAWLESDLIIGIKEPQNSQVELIKSGKLKGKILFTYLHLANPEMGDLLEALIVGEVISIAYETVSTINSSGRYEFPLLYPMSSIAGVLAVKNGAKYLEKTNRGEGIEVGIVPGIDNNPGKVVIIGGGAVGYSAAFRAVSLGAKVVIFDIDPNKRVGLGSDPVVGKAKILNSIPEIIAEEIKDADLLIGAVYVNGSKAPKIVSLEMTKSMPEGSVSIDVPIDQGGILEASSISHSTLFEPTFKLETGQIISAVPNMPGAVPKTASLALNNATLKYILMLADKGLEVLKESEELARGLNIYQGKVVIEGVSKAHNLSLAKNPYVTD